MAKFTDEGLHRQAIAAAKSKFKIWPSAFGSAWMTRHYRQLYKAKKGRSGGAFKGRSDSLKEWFSEDWKAINSSGKIVGGCGDGETKGKVKCLPDSKARSLSKNDRSTLAKRKQKQDPNPNREGAPVMVSSKKREDSMSPEVFARAILSIEQNYGLRLDARSVWLRMDEFKKVKELKKGKCTESRGWYGLKGACKRGKKGEGEARTKESKRDIVNRIKKRKMNRKTNGSTIDHRIAEYKVVRELGRGDFGAAVLTDRGTVIKIANGSRPRKIEESKAEFEALKQFSKLGIGPDAIGIDGTTIEMSLVSGQTIRTLKDSGISVKQHQKNQMMAAQSLLKLHKSGWSHNDSHLHNLVIDDKGQAKLLDAGAASKVGGMTWDGTGYHDIKSALRGHPSLVLLTKAMEPHEMAYRTAHTQAFQKEDKSTIDADLSQARVNLHNEYLKLSPKFIK